MKDDEQKLEAKKKKCDDIITVSVLAYLFTVIVGLVLCGAFVAFTWFNPNL